jgi:hypothetical protein
MSTLRIRHSIITGVVLVLGAVFTTLCHAACTVQKLATPAPKDPVARVLAAQDACPRTPREFVDALKRFGARMEPTMVNFIGFHNADMAEFFFIEIVSSAPPSITIQRGDLLFGHFTTADNDQLISVQDGGLTVELIAWDPDKQFYNFYELRDGNWIYQGDSEDILDDVQLLHRQRSASAPPFGGRLRCSGCHVNGGFRQKELTSPHNDWFVQDRHLPLGRLRPADAFVKEKLTDVVDAGELSKLVTASAQRLADSPGYRRVLVTRSMQERLRPLFCPMELNIESDAQPFDDRRPTLSLTAAFFVDPRLATAVISIERPHYDAALQRLGSSLPRTPGRADADHGWLTPVKAHSDIVAINALIEQGIVDKEFAADVLAVDFTNPVFSRIRCGLLKLVPDNAGPGFVGRFQSALRGAREPGAAELLNNLSDPARDSAFHERQALTFLTSCQQRAADPNAVLDWLRLLAQRRVEVSTSEISRNPHGHILENPGRVVFPLAQPQARLALTPACQVQ